MEQRFLTHKMTCNAQVNIMQQFRKLTSFVYILFTAFPVQVWRGPGLKTVTGIEENMP
jgi:hypothetical protein